MSKRCCLECNSSLSKKEQQKYCSVKCQRDYEYHQYIIRWLAGQEKGTKGWNQISSHVRRWLLEQRGEQCWLCGWNIKHSASNKCPLEADHIDGEHENNRPENLRLLCPNCHSLTLTYKNRNKGHGRRQRLERYRTGQTY